MSPYGRDNWQTLELHNRVNKLESELIEALEKLSILQAEKDSKSKEPEIVLMPPPHPFDTLVEGQRFRCLNGEYARVVKGPLTFDTTVEGWGWGLATKEDLELATTFPRSRWRILSKSRQSWNSCLWVLVSENVYWDIHRSRLDGLRNFLRGVAAAQVVHGCMRASKGHEPVFGSGLSNGQQWLPVEIARAFSATDRLIERLTWALGQKGTELLELVKAASYSTPIEAKAQCQKNPMTPILSYPKSMVNFPQVRRPLSF